MRGASEGLLNDQVNIRPPPLLPTWQSNRMLLITLSQVPHKVVHKSFYVDDCLTGATDTNSALLLQQQLTEIFGFVLRKWNANDPAVLQEIPEDLTD